MPQHEEAGPGPENETSEEALAVERERLVHWYDETLSARFWLELAEVDASEAAQLLSGERPSKDSEDWLEVTSWKGDGSHPLMAPEHRRRLLRGLEDTGGRRHLAVWARVARARNWRYDPWIDSYIEALNFLRPPSEAEARAAEVIDRLHAVQAKIKEWREKATPTAIDLSLQEEKLAQLDAEERMLDTAVKNLRGDFAEVDSLELLQAVVDSGKAPASDARASEAPMAGPEECPPPSPATPQAIIDGAKALASDAGAAGRSAPSWQVYEPGHDQGYARALYEVLKKANDAGLPRPNAREVLKAFKQRMPDVVVDVDHNSLSYETSTGIKKEANLAAIDAAIRRATSPKGPKSA